MAKRKDYTLRIRKDIMSIMENMAKAEQRSRNNMIEWILLSELKKRGIDILESQDH